MGDDESNPTEDSKPFAGYQDFEECVKDNQDKEDPEGFCAYLHHQETGEYPSEVNSSSSNKAPSRPDEVIEHKIFRPSEIADKGVVLDTEDIDGKEMDTLQVPISSTSVDRDRDNFDKDALQDMKQQLKSSDVGLFLDHGGENGDYPVLDIIGRWFDGKIEDEVLYGKAFLDPDEEKAQKLKNKLENNLPIAWSVGFANADKKENEHGGHRIKSCDLAEVSAVGIPSNPDAVSSLVDKVADEVRKKMQTKQAKDWDIKTPPYDESDANSSWDAPDLEDFEDEAQAKNAQLLVADDYEDFSEDAALPVCKPAGDELVLLYHGLDAAHKVIGHVEDLSEEEEQLVRSKIQDLRKEEFSDKDPIVEEGEEENMSDEESKQDEEDEETDAAEDAVAILAEYYDASPADVWDALDEAGITDEEESGEPSDTLSEEDVREIVREELSEDSKDSEEEDKETEEESESKATEPAGKIKTPNTSEEEESETEGKGRNETEPEFNPKL